MTKELFFLAGSAAPLHDAAAELRREGFLVRDQPHDFDGTWSLVAYSAASELSEKDLATLDSIAERCGVEFDGSGTYVGPPHLDNGPGNPPQHGKLAPRVRERFFPAKPVKLFTALAAASSAERRAAENVARSFMETLIRMTLDERRLLAHLFAEGCRTQLPDNVHINLDIVRRDLGFAPTDVLERLRAMTSLGFELEVRPDEEHGDDVLAVRWIDTMISTMTSRSIRRPKSQ